MPAFDALLVVSFGGPEKPEDVLPFLDNVLRGRPVPEERKREVAAHYLALGGKSPLNDQCRALVAAVEADLDAHGKHLPVYWGNRNWHPLLADTLRRMADDGVKRALAFVTSAYSSYSGCRQYRENLEAARAEVGARAPEVQKLRAYFNHPGFVEPMARNLREAFARIPEPRRAAAALVFTAHSLPLAMARNCDYEVQLGETCRLVAQGAGRDAFRLAYQSRSGGPGMPWLEPDIKVALQVLQAEGARDVVVAPVGFISDHMEVVYDLDTDAAARAQELGLSMVRAATVGTAPEFVAMIRELVQEREEGAAARVLGSLGPRADVCADECCLPGTGRPLEAAVRA